jgi:hypothetical protein
MDLGLTLKRANNPPMYTTSPVPIWPFSCLLSWNEKTNGSQDHEGLLWLLKGQTTLPSTQEVHSQFDSSLVYYLRMEKQMAHKILKDSFMKSCLTAVWSDRFHWFLESTHVKDFKSWKLFRELNMKSNAKGIVEFLLLNLQGKKKLIL